MFRRSFWFIASRLFWLAVGFGLGFGLSYELVRVVRQAAARCSPERVMSALRAGSASVVAELREASRSRQPMLDGPDDDQVPAPTAARKRRVA